MPGQFSSRSRRAYTLVEILIVLGLIAILIGLLLPAIGQARARSIEVACQKNLSDIYKGLQLYRGEFKDYLPRQGSLSAADWSPQMPVAVARYFVSTRPLSWEAVSKVSVLRCRTSSFPEASTTYIVNAMNFAAMPAFEQPRYAHRWRQIVKNLSELPLVFDSPPGGLGHCPETLPLSRIYADGLMVESLQAVLKPEHLSETSVCRKVGLDAHGKLRCNVLYADGNVRSMDVTKIQLQNFDDGIR
jgi:prepilin-type N-terminal cleavage/methylation domain-containing protein/prepilin-type processing-associated H-X9-DG protein